CTQLTVTHGAGTAKERRSMAPAAGLDATDRYVQCLPRGHHDAGVKDSILLGTDQLLPRHEEDHDIGLVDRPDCGNCSLLADLGNLEQLRAEGLIQRSVLHLLARLRPKAKGL